MLVGASAAPQVGDWPLGKTIGPGLIAKAREMGVKLPPGLDTPGAVLAPGAMVPFLRSVAGHFFPLLARDPDVD